MTIKDKIEQLENLKCHCSDMGKAECSSNEWMKDIEALDFAIATVKQETCEDCVSRQAVLDLINADWKYEGLELPVNELPPVTPTFPKGTTNGDMIKAMFSDIEIWGESKATLDYSLGGMIHRVTKSWWNAPYKRGNENENDIT